MYNPVVTIRTSSLTLNNSTFCPHTVFICFVWISEQTAIISLYNINWLVFITETASVYCAVRTGCCNIIQPLDDPLKPSGHYMYHQFNIQQLHVLPTQCIYVFCVDLRTNSDCFTIQHYWLIFITQTECLLRGTYRIFTCSLFHTKSHLYPRRSHRQHCTIWTKGPSSLVQTARLLICI